MNIQKVIVLSCIVWFAAVIQAQSESDIKEKLDRAGRYRAEDRGSPDAEKIYRSIILQDTRNFEARYYLGLTLNQQKRTPEAIIQLGLAKDIILEKIQNDEDDIHYPFFNSFGWVYLINADFHLAKEEFLTCQKYIEHLSENTIRRLYNNLGITHFMLDELDEAERILGIARDKYDSDLAVKNLERIAQRRSAGKLQIDELVQDLIQEDTAKRRAALQAIRFGHLNSEIVPVLLQQLERPDGELSEQGIINMLVVMEEIPLSAFNDESTPKALAVAERYSQYQGDPDGRADAIVEFGKRVRTKLSVTGETRIDDSDSGPPEAGS